MLMAVIGAPLGGVITDQLRKRRLNARMLFPSVTSFTAAFLFFVAFMFFSGIAQYAILLCAGLIVIMFVAGASAVTQDVAHPGLRAMAYSLAVLVQNLLGASLGPLFVGVISDHYGLQTGIRLLPLAPLFSGIAFLIGSFYYERDLARTERVALVHE